MLDNLSGDLFQKLKIFHHIMQYGSVAQAAGALHKSPSSISRQLQQLEEDLGITLLHRRTDGMLPTPEGKVLYEHTLKLFKDIETLLYSVASPARKEKRISGTVKFIAAPVVCEYLLPRLLPELLRHYPDITLDISSAYGIKPSIKMLTAHDCHFALIGQEDFPPGLDFQPLYTTQVCLISSDGCLLPEGAGDDLQMLQELPFIFIPEGVAITRFIRKVCAQSGIVLNMRHRAPTMAVLVSMVRAGMGMALVDAEHLKAFDLQGISVNPMRAFPRRTFGIVQRHNAFQPPHVQAVLNLIRSSLPLQCLKRR